MATTQLVQPTSATIGDLPYIGAQANDNEGTPLRDSFSKLNDAITAIYGAQNSGGTPQTPFVDGDNIKDDTINEGHLSVTNSPVDGYVLTYDSSTQGFTWEQKFDGDITSIAAGNGLTGSSLEDGDAILNVVGGDGITSNTDEIEVTVDDSTIELSATDGSGAVRIKNNGVDHQQLSNSYTELSPLGTGSSFALNFDSACTFTATMDNNATFTLSNAQQGQVIDLIVDGNFTVTFAETGSTFNKVGSTSYDGSTDNIIQIMCTDDTDGAKVYHFAVGTYSSSTTA